MPVSVQIPASTFKEAVAGLVAKTEDKQKLLARVPADNSAVTVYLSPEDKPLLEELLKLRIAKTTRMRIAQFVTPIAIPILQGISKEEVLSNMEVKPQDFSNCMTAVGNMQGQAFEVKIMDRWYTFKMPKLKEAKWNKRIVGFYFQIKFQMVRATFTISKVIYRENFKEIYANKTLTEILQNLDIRVQDTTDPDQNSSRLVGLSISMAEDYGKQILVRGPVLEVKNDTSNTFHGSDRSWETKKHIYEKEKAVVEPELELPGVRRMSSWHEQDHQTEEMDGVLPFVRAFSLRTRTFLYTDFRNVEVYQYKADIENRLLLKPQHRRIIKAIFAAGEDTVKDLIPGKTGGICVLAWGNPGVGKTLTAEVYAEEKERPLYALSVSEIGTEPREIENNLQRVFTRVERWNAVLLFDECDVFISKRGDDIKQSAVVGMFLRLLDYYSGTMFLTTNRASVIDPAVDSRLAFRIHYDDLDTATRKEIWVSLLIEAKVEYTEQVLGLLVLQNLDGRKIRNMVRAIQLNKIKTLTKEDIDFLLPYILDQK